MRGISGLIGTHEGMYVRDYSLQQKWKLKMGPMKITILSEKHTLHNPRNWQEERIKLWVVVFHDQH